jgi:preprotein translocase subunit SecG
MTLFLTVLHVMVCLFLVVVVLLQRGKGAEIGAVFGGGSGSTLFGSRGAGNFLTKLTTGAAVVFMITSLSLAYFAQEGVRSEIFDEDASKQEQPASPFAEPGANAPAAEGEPAPAGSGFEEVPAPADAPAADAAPEAAAEGPAADPPQSPPAEAPSTP